MDDNQEKNILENQKLIYKVLKKYNLYDKRDEYFDLGMIGLIKGVKSFDSNKNIKLSTYLYRCISNEILSYMRKKRPITVSISNEVLGQKDELTYEETIPDLKIDVEKEAMTHINFERVNEILSEFPLMEQLIINHLFNINGYEFMTQKKLASIFGITQTTVNRIKYKVLTEIRKKMQND